MVTDTMIERVANDHDSDGKFSIDAQYNNYNYNYNDEIDTTAAATLNVNVNANEKDDATINGDHDTMDGGITTQRLLQVPRYPTFAPSPFSATPSTKPHFSPTLNTRWPTTPWPTWSFDDTIIDDTINETLGEELRKQIVWLGISGGLFVIVLVGFVIKLIVDCCRGRSPGRTQRQRQLPNVTAEEIPAEDSVVGFAVAVAIPADSQPTATTSGSATPNNHYPTAYATSQDTVG